MDQANERRRRGFRAGRCGRFLLRKTAKWVKALNNKSIPPFIDNEIIPFVFSSDGHLPLYCSSGMISIK
jgi:hypothetical protein